MPVLLNVVMHIVVIRIMVQVTYFGEYLLPIRLWTLFWCLFIPPKGYLFLIAVKGELLLSQTGSLILKLYDHQFQAFDLLIKPERHQEAL